MSQPRLRIVEHDPFKPKPGALVASSFPDVPPLDWFQDPGFKQVTPMQVTPDGHIQGHLAPWTARHVGLGNVRPPRSSSGYGYFRTGVLACAAPDGAVKDVPVGQITLVGGHAPITADADSAVRHYDDTNSAVADIAVGEDKHGIWYNGAIRPGVKQQQVRVLRASAVSGDWRPIQGRLEMVALCSVNSPGFPVARTLVASANSEPVALVAAGAAEMYMLGLEREVPNLDVRERLDSLEALVASLQADAQREQLRRRVNGR